MLSIKIITQTLAVLCIAFSFIWVAFLLPSWPMILFWTGCLLWLFGCVYGVLHEMHKTSKTKDEPIR